MTPGRVRQEINNLTNYLLSVGLAEDRQDAFERKTAVTEISFRNANFISDAVKASSYSSVFSLFVSERVFNAQLVDGALIQCTYTFKNNKLLKHRLAFLPPPGMDWTLRSVRPREYEDEDTEEVSNGGVGQPLRFDFNARDEKHRDVIHPKCHLTLGDHSTCRIPVTSPVTPYWFIYFVLLNFCSTSGIEMASSLPKSSDKFTDSISREEKKIPYLVVPQ